MEGSVNKAVKLGSEFRLIGERGLLSEGHSIPGDLSAGEDELFTKTSDSGLPG